MESEVRPWGRYVTVGYGEAFKVKYIEVNPHSRLSLQKHKHRSEHWYIVEGTGYITINDLILAVHPEEHYFIPAGAVHRVWTSGSSLKFVEIQTGTYFGEDDIERLEDDYGRADG